MFLITVQDFPLEKAFPNYNFYISKNMIEHFDHFEMKRVYNCIIISLDIMEQYTYNDLSIHQ